MKLIAKQKDKECSFCGKVKKTVTVELDTGKQTQLCIKDLDKMTEIMLPEAERVERPAGR